MGLLIIDSYIINLIPRYKSGDELASLEAQILNKIFLDQWMIKLTQFVNSNPGLTNLQIQIEADIIANEMRIEVPDFDHSETIIKEAKSICQDPQLIDLALTHAQNRVEAKLRAGLKMIKNQSA